MQGHAHQDRVARLAQLQARQGFQRSDRIGGRPPITVYYSWRGKLIAYTIVASPDETYYVDYTQPVKIATCRRSTTFNPN